MSQILEPRPPLPRMKSGSTLPPLENGDHLDQRTFHERYEAMGEDFKAELIQGKVYVPSPVRRKHARPHSLVATWLGHYEAATPGVESLTDASAILDDENEPQPDCFLLVKPEYGGQTHVDDENYIVGPPELAVEITASTESYDLFEKRETYEQTGVQEYVIFIVRTQEVRWLRLEEGRYNPTQPADDGLYHSSVFPGLWLDPQALISEDARKLIESLDQGLASPEHAEFVKGLDSRQSA